MEVMFRIRHLDQEKHITVTGKLLYDELTVQDNTGALWFLRGSFRQEGENAYTENKANLKTTPHICNKRKIISLPLLKNGNIP